MRLVMMGTMALMAAACGQALAPAEAPPATRPGAEVSSPTPRQQPGAGITIYAPEQHDLYDGRFIIAGGRVHMVGGLNDPEGWDHLDNSGATAHAVEGTVTIDVNEIENTGTFDAALTIPEGEFVLTLDRFHEFNPCQDGGIAAYLHEHGSNAGCGDMNWPKTFGYVAGWGYGHATLDGKPLYEDYEVHFMVTQGIRDRETLQVENPQGHEGAGAVNPAAQQIDFYIRSPQPNERNTPGREVFAHFFAMEVTWK
ncbi:MAG: hypothetical protein FJW23_09325 [Acidimicrobiia bacterium]|nr:hypothetical protein [Acidimicrobiia bacterium]